MTTFNDAIKDETQITDEKIIEYGQKVRTWLEGELANCASEHRQDFIDTIKRINGIVAGEIEDDDIFGIYYPVVKSEDYLVEYDKAHIRLAVTLTPILPDEIFQLFKIGQYVNFPLFENQLDGVRIIVKGESDDNSLIDTGFLFVNISQRDENRVGILLSEH